MLFWRLGCLLGYISSVPTWLWQFKWLREGLIYYYLLNYTHSLLLLQGLDSNESAFGVKYVGSQEWHFELLDTLPDFSPWDSCFIAFVTLFSFCWLSFLCWTTLYYQPGLLYGGSLEHDCSVLRGVGIIWKACSAWLHYGFPLQNSSARSDHDQVDPSVSNEATPHCDFCLLSHLTSEKLVPDKTQFIVECICFVIYLEV